MIGNTTSKLRDLLDEKVPSCEKNKQGKCSQHHLRIWQAIGRQLYCSKASLKKKVSASDCLSKNPCTNKLFSFLLMMAFTHHSFTSLHGKKKYTLLLALIFPLHFDKYSKDEIFSSIVLFFYLNYLHVWSFTPKYKKVSIMKRNIERRIDINI